MDKVSLEMMPGWDNNSYGYHGDDGKIFHGEACDENYGPTFLTGA